MAAAMITVNNGGAHQGKNNEQADNCKCHVMNVSGGRWVNILIRFSIKNRAYLMVMMPNAAGMTSSQIHMGTEKNADMPSAFSMRTNRALCQVIRAQITVVNR